MAELEDDLRVAHCEAVLVNDAPTQDEGVVVKMEALRVQEEHLADLRRGVLEFLAGKIHVDASAVRFTILAKSSKFDSAVNRSPLRMILHSRYCTVSSGSPSLYLPFLSADARR